MDYNNALKILNLHFGFTDSDLKRAYRKLCKKWHPDLFVSRSESEQKLASEKMQEVNEAYDFLCKTTNKKKKTYSYDNFNVVAYAKSRRSQLQAYLNMTFKNYSKFPSFIILAYKRIELIINNYDKILKMKKPFTITYIDTLYETCVFEIHDVYKKLMIDYYREFYINDSSVSESINYDCYFREFIHQLDNIRTKYSLIELFEKRIFDETEQYKLYTGYEQLSSQIDNCIKKAKDLAKKQGYKNLDEIIFSMHTQIKNCFSDYFKASDNSSHVDLADLIRLVDFYGDEHPDIIRSRYRYNNSDFIESISEIDKFYNNCEDTIRVDEDIIEKKKIKYK